MKYIGVLIFCFLIGNLFGQNNSVFISITPGIVISSAEREYKDIFSKNITNHVDSIDQLINTPFLKKEFSYGISIGYKRKFKNLYLTASADYRNTRFKMEYEKYGVFSHIPTHTLGMTIGVLYRIKVYNSWFLSPNVALSFSKPLNNNVELFDISKSGTNVFYNTQIGQYDTINYFYSYSYKLKSSYFYSINIGLAVGKEFKNGSRLEIGFGYNNPTARTNYVEAYKSYGNVENIQINNTFSRLNSERFKNQLFSIQFVYSVPIVFGYKHDK